MGNFKAWHDPHAVQVPDLKPSQVEIDFALKKRAEYLQSEEVQERISFIKAAIQAAEQSWKSKWAVDLPFTQKEIEDHQKWWSRQDRQGAGQAPAKAPSELISKADTALSKLWDLVKHKNKAQSFYASVAKFSSTELLSMVSNPQTPSDVVWDLRDYVCGLYGRPQCLPATWDE